MSKEVELNKKQEEINKLYAEEGLTDKVLDMQIALNSERHELDIPDSSEKTYKNYVQ